MEEGVGEDSLASIRSRLRQRSGIHNAAPIRELESLARSFFRSRFKLAFEQVDDVFFDLADRSDDSAQQTSYFDAMRMIRLERGNVEKTFEGALKRTFDALLARSIDSVNDGTMSPDGQRLSIVADDDLEEMIALDTMVSRAREKSQPDLDLLTERLCHLVGGELDKKKNPFNPEVICDALGSAVKGLPLDIRSKLVLLKLFERKVLDVLKELIAKCNLLLVHRGVLPDLQLKQAAKNSSSQPESTALNPSDTASPQGRGDGAPVSDPAKISNGKIVSQLAALLSQVDAHSPQGGMAMDDLLSTIVALDAERTKTDDASAANGCQSLAGSLLKRLEETGAGDQLGVVNKSIVQLVDKLFTQITDRFSDHGAVNNQVRKLEPAILRVALEDHEFFDKEKHPARRLINEIVQASLAFQEKEDLSKDPVAQYISYISDSLVSADVIDNAKLTHMLANFLELVERDQRRAASLEQRLLEQVAASERVNEAHRQVDRILHERMLGKEFPRALVDFAQKAWCKVLFMDCLRHKSRPEQLQQDTQTLDKLLRLVGENDLSVVKSALESLLPELRNKLAEIAFDAYEAGNLLGGVEEYFKLRQEFGLRSPLQPAVAEERAVVEKVIVKHLQSDLPGEVDDQDVEVSASVSDQARAVLESLRRGSWVEYREKEDETTRCKVAGIVSPPGKYIFVNRRGAKVAEKRRQRVALEIEQGKLVVLDNSHLFDDVLENVIRDIHKMRAGA